MYNVLQNHAYLLNMQCAFLTYISMCNKTPASLQHIFLTLIFHLSSSRVKFFFFHNV